ncbi:MAG: heme ABC transporter permease [Rhodospirillaceae bacterium]|nr:heme ABC transporter permease [Rhodospirillaceae bacterium]
MADLHRFANPTRFLKLAGLIQPWALAVFLISATVGLYMAFFTAPADYQQGESARIMYVHVPASWMAMFCYTVMAVASAVSLIWKHPLADVSARATAPIGAAFTFLALATGSLWGKPMWGTWWVWDARLTSVLVLLFLYIGYMALQGAFDDRVRAAKASAILALVGFVNVPIIKFSVDWWNTLHQPASVVKMSGSSIHPSMLWPLLIMAIAFKAYYVWVLLVRMRQELVANKVRILRLKQVHGG